MKSICIIIPAYNEAKVIGDVLDDLPEFIDVGKEQMQVYPVVVNDGSVDSTAKVVAKRPKVKLINHTVNSGAGGATRTGLRYAREKGFSFALTMDADGQHATEDVVRLAQEIVNKKADLIIGSRLLDKEGMVWYRLVGNYGLNVITFLLFGVRVSDSQSGLRAFSKKAVKAIDLYSSSYAFCSEMVWVAKRRELIIAELPIRAIYSDYSLGKGQSSWNGVPLVTELVKRRVMDLLND
jgi:glycosyltransferase involved in cell wall biosynthesis